ncbi:VWA containing CoxE family protein [Sulfolobus islandicus Y.G.57.14]|uniref:VWA containing CoxE family protein n=1 Tax=Saccharolobus islandicus (strain Y.G.57.14 / Yellowstone \|nr:VWA domain-containing protein [Sulfolobus islandicus]ACP45126.1 VWA containing CoxE family protein [Sulfolobus islandicus Y.G.57.14]
MEERIAIVKIANILRQMGRNVGIDETIDALRALELIRDKDLDTIRAILKATLIKDFTLLESNKREEEKNSVIGKITQSNYLAAEYYIYSPIESKAKLPSFIITNSDLIKWSKIAKYVEEITLNYKGRRFKPKDKGEIDMRRTIRSETKYSMESPYLLKSVRKINKSNLILLCDVSGSMKDFFKETILLSFFIKRNIPKSEIFHFSTDLRRVTNLFQVTSIYKVNVRKLALAVSYGSGTKIGEALYMLRRNFGDLIHHNNSILIFSDGWDLGDLELLDREMRIIKRRCKKIVWMNPLLDELHPPETSGMKIALKYVDLLLSPDIKKSLSY